MYASKVGQQATCFQSILEVYRVFTGTPAGPVASRHVFAEEFKKINNGLIYAKKTSATTLRSYCWECVRARLLGSRQKKRRCQMIDIQSATAEIRRGKEEKEEVTTTAKYNGLPNYYGRP